MQYSEPEIKFLMGQHKVERAMLNGEQRGLGAILDLREIGCPPHVFEKILEDRAQKLGRKFVEFRMSQQRDREAVPIPASDLDTRVEASKLF